MSVGLIVDIIAAVIIAFFLFRGLFRGFSGEIVGLVGFFASLFCGWKFAQPASVFVLKYFNNFDPTITALICGIIIFIAVSLGFALINSLLSMIVQAANLSVADHALGIIIGIIKALCLILIVYGVLATFSPVIPTEWMNESYVMRSADVVWPYARDFLQENGILDFNALAGSLK